MRLLLPLAFVVLTGGLTAANDTLATLAAGGVVPLKTSDIIMESEELEISTEKITVKYVFYNESDRDIEAVVAFPLPEIDGATLHMAPIELPRQGTNNFVDFRVWVNGRPVEPKEEVKAFKDGHEIGMGLERFGLPVSVLDPKMSKAIRELPWRLRQDFIADEKIVEEKTEIGGKEKTEYWPWWQTRIQYYWTQRFPARERVQVMHTYKPVVGGSYLVEGSSGEHLTESDCMDPEFNSQLAMAKAPESRTKTGSNITYVERRIEYILRTATNWKGPIRDFRLRIHTDDPSDELATCFAGLRRTALTVYESHEKDFVPDADLNLLILQRAK